MRRHILDGVKYFCCKNIHSTIYFITDKGFRLLSVMQHLIGVGISDQFTKLAGRLLLTNIVPSLCIFCEPLAFPAMENYSKHRNLAKKCNRLFCMIISLELYSPPAEP
uniref:Uncharacterized protein n=1 Tax=Opuntia streptacantha TaxID=393608 RepID=A0A7C8YEJ9_OPUST